MTSTERACAAEPPTSEPESGSGHWIPVGNHVCTVIPSPADFVIIWHLHAPTSPCSQFFILSLITSESQYTLSHKTSQFYLWIVQLCYSSYHLSVTFFYLKSIWDNPEPPLIPHTNGKPNNYLRCTHRSLDGSEVLQGTTAGLQGGIFLGRAQQRQVGLHCFGMAQPLHTWWWTVLWHFTKSIKWKLNRKIEKEERKVLDLRPATI